MGKLSIQLSPEQLVQLNQKIGNTYIGHSNVEFVKIKMQFATEEHIQSDIREVVKVQK